MGTTLASKQIFEEARKTSHTCNTVYVKIGDLRQLLWDRSTIGEEIDVRGLIRNIAVAIEISTGLIVTEGLKKPGDVGEVQGC